MPLPMPSRRPQDLAFKTEVERQYLIFNLMAGGRVAWEAGDFARAAHEWEALLKVPGLPAEIARVVSPLLADAQRVAAAAGSPPAGAEQRARPPRSPEPPASQPRPARRARRRAA